MVYVSMLMMITMMLVYEHTFSCDLIAICRDKSIRTEISNQFFWNPIILKFLSNVFFLFNLSLWHYYVFFNIFFIAPIFTSHTDVLFRLSCHFGRSFFYTYIISVLIYTCFFYKKPSKGLSRKSFLNFLRF